MPLAASARVVAHLAFRQQHGSWVALAIADVVGLGIEAAFGAADTTGDSPFLKRSRRAVGHPSGRIDHYVTGFRHFAGEV